jgi:small subunit ribosomal protein S6
VPQYELMYILSSNVPDNEEPALTDSITAFISELGGEIQKVEKLGKRKLAYPIKRTRNGFYVLVNFKLAPDKVAELDHKIRMTGNIIRHLMINLEESLMRQAKDREEQKVIRRRMPPRPEAKTESIDPSKPKIEIDLDKQISKALEEDITQ